MKFFSLAGKKATIWSGNMDVGEKWTSNATVPAFGESAVEFGEESGETAGGVGIFWGNCGKGRFFHDFPFGGEITEEKHANITYFPQFPPFKTCSVCS